ncbi:MAG: glycosyltransferase [Planctomycetota bacterium]
MPHAPPDPEPPPKVAYVVSRFPKLTETFVLYEILEMERLGVTVEIYPLLRGRERVVHAEARALAGRAHYQPFLSLSVILAQWHYIRRRPLAYLKVLAATLSGTFGSANFFFGALGIFPKAVRFACEMETQNVAHVHAHFANHPAVAALIIHGLTGIPFSFTARGSDIHVDRRMLKQKLEAAAFAITVSSYNKELMVNECGPPVGDKIHVIYGGVDTDRLSPRPGAQSDEPFRIVCVARFEEVKGHAYLVEACRLLRDRGVGFECHLIGDGPLRQTVERQIAQAGLKDRVKLLGARPYADVIEQLSRASVVVLATVPAASGKREGIPNVLKEAMACGLPVVASSISGIPELVDHGGSGFLVPPRDTSALADVLQRLHGAPAVRRQMGRAGRERIVRAFNLRASVAQRAALFLETLPW